MLKQPRAPRGSSQFIYIRRCYMYNEELSKGLSKRQLKGQTRIESEDTLILDSPEWTIVIPHTHRAAIYWSKNSFWDTAMKHEDVWFNEYNKRGNLYIMWDKSNNKGYQLHIETNSLFDDKNGIVIPIDFFGSNHTLFNAIYLHLDSGDKRAAFIDMLLI